MNLFAELRRRNVIRMAGLYLVGAWLAVQVAATLLPVFEAPAWVMKALVVLLAIGFLAALVFAWVFELTPEGLKRDGEVPVAESIAPQTARRLDRGIIVVLLLALGFFALDRFVLAPQREPALVANAAQAVQSRAPDVATPTDQRASIAVLPFVNMSSDQEQEYFSDGLSEELLNQLAQIAQLRVIARTSSFSFKGKELDVASIAKALDVAHVLEGSVRKSGNTLRITAQLVRASDSSHLWSQTYDRDLTDVFKVQDEISREVVAALKLKLLPDQRIASTQRTNNTAAYEQYLIGMSGGRVGGRSFLEASQAAFDRAIALDPSYANAYAQRADVQRQLADFTETPAQREAMIAAALASADQAIALAPDLADGYAVRAVARFSLRSDWHGAQTDFDRALALDPNRAATLTSFAGLLFSLDRREEGLAAANKAVTSDPLSGNAWFRLGRFLEAAGNIPKAKQAYLRALTIDPKQHLSNFWLGSRLLREADIDEAAAHFQRAVEPWRSTGMAMVEFSRGNDAASRQLLATLEEDYAVGFAFQIAQAYAWRGEKDQAFAWLERCFAVNDAGLSRLPYDPTLDPLRSDPRLAALLRRMGFPE
ncbi:MAG: tetratricopeptide repeat protein [Chiayiivirga sp.]|jgi:adenylate cyclase|uniref:tetratricopeptide repeat protein n=1 Tax=Chiayiivirga sp. TaxID=2041042 RepID=UPI0025C64CAF|nr:tetratricopeptide repeat protein [Chiayiivirga sp.]MCI1729438.1 tetratricopeptide repeat protein [Chiayiivirga sp.]